MPEYRRLSPVKAELNMDENVDFGRPSFGCGSWTPLTVAGRAAAAIDDLVLAY